MKISVLTPSYNSAAFIERAIKSVLAQNYDNWEHIIVDGGSGDGTVDVLRKYDHLKWVSEADQGQSDAMNKAFHLSTGYLIVYLNSDDEFLPGYFKKTVDYFEKVPDSDMVVADLFVDKKGSRDKFIPSVKLIDILNLQQYRFPLNPVSYIYKRKLQERIGDFPVDNHYTMDYWFLLRAYGIGHIKKIEYPAGVFYFNEKNKSADAERAKTNLLKVRKKFIERYWFNKNVIIFSIKKNLMKIADLRNKIVKKQYDSI